MSLRCNSSNNSKKEKNTNHRLVSLTGTNHSNSTLSRNIQFEKDVHFFFNTSENLLKNQSVKVLFWRISTFPYNHFK